MNKFGKIVSPGVYWLQYFQWESCTEGTEADALVTIDEEKKKQADVTRVNLAAAAAAPTSSSTTAVSVTNSGSNSGSAVYSVYVRQQ